MAHNFKLTGNIYVSKVATTIPGDGGVTPDNPRPLITPIGGGNSSTYIIGAGQYSISNLGAVQARKFTADGYVKLISNGSLTPLFLASSSAGVWTGIHFEGYTTALYRYSASGVLSFINCIFENCNFESMLSMTTTFSNCVFINCTGTIASGTVSNLTITKNIFINCNLNIVLTKSQQAIIRNLTLNFFNEGCNIEFVDFDPTFFTNNNCNCTSLSAYVGSSGNINLPPEFNNIFAQDFTLKRTSPHLSRNIGPSWLRLGNSFFLKGDETEVTSSSGHYFEGTASGQQFPIYSANNLIASVQEDQLRMKIIEAVGGEFVGKFKVKLKLSEVPVSVATLNFVAGLNFNTDYPSSEGLFNPNNPEVLNNNVPNGFNWASGHEGRNPNRLDYSMRWSTKDNPDLNTASDWITGEDYLIFEWNTVPAYNPISLKGNADPDFETTPSNTDDNPKAIIATWIDIEVTLMNNYYSK